jgi:diacylglycerol kinase (ATP)
VSGKFSLGDRLRSFRFALAGLRYFLASEHNTRIHLALTLAAVALGALARISLNEWRWLLLAVALVWVTEAFNTSIERLGDAVSLEHDPRIGHAKDVAATAVLLAAVASALIGLSIFGPHLLAWLER